MNIQQKTMRSTATLNQQILKN